MSIFKGNATAMITPFNDDGIDFDAFNKHIEFQISNGTVALVVAGTTGEPATMTHDEKINLFKFALKQVNKRVPVIIGTGCNSTAQTIINSKEAEDLGADGLLLVTPYYNKTTQDGLAAHFTAVADAVNTPVITYNVPSRTGLNLLPETLHKICKHENIVAHKEAAGTVRQIMNMVRLCADDIDILSGDDALTFPLLACGGKGAISVVSNVAPRKSQDMVESFLTGDINKARELQYELDDLIKQLFVQVNPIPVKCAMNIMGMNAGIVRMPLLNMSGKDKDDLENLLNDIGLI